VGTAGDVNNDGYADAIVGASSYDNGETDEGRVFAYYGTVADLTLSKSDSADPVEGASPLTYTLSVTNTGPHTATAVIVTDTLPEGCTYIHASGSGWTCIHTAGSISCTRPELAMGAAPPITILVTVPSISGTITNTAGVTSEVTDPDRGNNGAVERTVITCFPAAAPAFSWEPPTPTLGTAITFQGTATGTGPISFTWDLGEGTKAGGISITHIYTMSGEYHVVLTASNLCGWERVSNMVRVSDLAPLWYRAFFPLVHR
jgi:uncharacterized repeat protein (TIGR01451 family)